LTSQYRNSGKDLVLSSFCCIFAASKRYSDEKNKPYPIIEEEDGSCLTAQEPTTAYTPEFSIKDNRPQIPNLPQTWDELVKCLKEGEDEIERGEYVEWETAVQQMRQYRHYVS
jgi:hypothetical protein